MSYVRLEKLRKSFGSLDILHGIDLEIARSEFLVLLGPSGCGKSTSLRMLAGLETVSSGRIFIDGRDVTGLEPRERDIAMVFQNYALYPTMTVGQNIGFGLKAKKMPADQIKKKVDEAAKLLNLSHLLDRKPGALSGGQQQRVAIGRAIVRQPKVFLFDEPLSNLDAKLRVEMRAEILRLHNELQATTIYVTHDQEEAMTMADRIVVMKDGLIEQVGTPEDIYFRPATRMVAGFIGSPAMNFIAGTGAGPCRIDSALGALKVDAAVREGQAVEIGIRPDNVTLAQSGYDGDNPVVPMTVKLVELLGPRAIVSLEHASGQAITAVVPYADISSFRTGSQVDIMLAVEAMHVFPVS
ncbi:ABC transporter ATP-binding protein [Oceanibium sediminis]|uniref:ABC transporter ATP-binding protein n=1 Tax=Oceanibium sediminis TaxID=2026339 RepID=UPI000DD4C8BE|nr:ABC transporter ATP-binding protein [Oceanibium sediminis]